MPSFARIKSTGSYLPPKVVTNDDLAEFLETSDEWIRQRVGIVSRHVAETETTTDLAEKAAKNAIESAGLDPKKIGLVIVATGTPDYLMPSTASILQHRLGIDHVPSFDLSAACGGFVYALDVAKQYIENESIEYALVIGAERLSRALDWQDRSTSVLFGDGAGAVILGKDDSHGIKASVLHSDGQDLELLNVPNALPKSLYQNDAESALLQMQGNKVFKKAVSRLSMLADQLLEKANITQAQLDWLVPHQANLRILEATAKKLSLPLSQVIVTLQHHGNTSAASIPLALDHAVSCGKIKREQTLLIEAFGAGFVWGGMVLTF
ncbi:ketoacyl-ACP synthase III [Thiotrichales bacterium 19S11-10]|nr:ketoacyl-ACP synthase III [Thiotrichales bacterium 19S11-10]MCF6807090.1 ketoacyl-ACP synthase III [Thiotrichales bacterium 19S9-11]MCF6811059.1 ketoacyl-ACP synthase III [Thiotrichales bacterium 19S9-12]